MNEAEYRAIIKMKPHCTWRSSCDFCLYVTNCQGRMRKRRQNKENVDNKSREELDALPRARTHCSENKLQHTWQASVWDCWGEGSLAAASAYYQGEGRAGCSNLVLFSGHSKLPILCFSMTDWHLKLPQRGRLVYIANNMDPGPTPPQLQVGRC